MQIWSQAATLAKNSLASDTPFLLLVEVISKELAEPICLVRNTENIVRLSRPYPAIQYFLYS